MFLIAAVLATADAASSWSSLASADYKVDYIFDTSLFVDIDSS